MRRAAWSLLTIPLVAGAAAAADASALAKQAHPSRVLIFSLPQVSWSDLETFPAPNLNRFLDHAAIAALTTRAEQRVTHLGDGYVTLNAGTRAVGDGATDGDNLEVGEHFGRDSAGAVYRRRTGRTVTRGIVSLANARVVETNKNLLYNAEIGSLALALRDAGFDRAVIANGDGAQPDSPPSPSASRFKRQAALALSDPQGRLPGGRVDDGLLENDPGAPFGKRLNQQKVLAAFARSWRARSVVLVEGSDLVREDAVRPFATPVQRDVMLRAALQRTDRLFGALLEHVDAARDAVVVVGPAHSARAITLTVLGVRAPQMEAGLLRSATTRRSGFVQLIDVAPTILNLLGVDRPTSMEGRPAEVGGGGGSPADRRDLLVRADEAAQFRDQRVGEVQTAIVVISGVLVAGLLLLFRRLHPRWMRTVLGRVALCALAFVPATFLARLFPLDQAGVVPYWAYLVVVSVALGSLFHRAGRHDPITAVLVALLANVVLLAGDVILGSRLQFNSALGYSPTVAGRFTGFGNSAYAALAASSVLAAPVLARRIGGRRGAWVAIGLLGAAVLVDSAPFWGSDVGGTLSMVPAFAITAVLLLGRSIRVRTVLSTLAALALAIVLFTGLDLLRAPEHRTHLGRLAERIDQRGIGDFLVTIHRKLNENLSAFTHSVWGFMLPIAAWLIWWLVRRAPNRLRALSAAVPEGRVAMVGFAIVGVLGFLLNDSGIAIPGVMLAILIASTVWLLTQIEPESGRLGQPAATDALAR
jgi:hypothetical protein